MKKKLIPLFLLIFAILFSFSSCKNDGRVIFLLYHNIAESEIPEGLDPEYTVTAEKFKSDIEYLVENGYKSISTEMYINGEYSKRRNYFVITFDDGYMSNYTLAYPYLLENKLYADIFVCTGNEYLDNHFSWEQGRQMENSGFVTLYSHTEYHTALFSFITENDYCDYLDTVNKGYEDIKNNTQREHLKIMSYPQSEYNEMTARLLYDDGYLIQFIQILPEGYGYSFNAEDYGLVRRYSIGSYTEISDVLEGIYD